MYKSLGGRSHLPPASLAGSLGERWLGLGGLGRELAGQAGLARLAGLGQAGWLGLAWMARLGWRGWPRAILARLAGLARFSGLEHCQLAGLAWPGWARQAGLAGLPWLGWAWLRWARLG